MGSNCKRRRTVPSCDGNPCVTGRAEMRGTPVAGPSGFLEAHRWPTIVAPGFIPLSAHVQRHKGEPLAHALSLRHICWRRFHTTSVRAAFALTELKSFPGGFAILLLCVPRMGVSLKFFLFDLFRVSSLQDKFVPTGSKRLQAYRRLGLVPRAQLADMLDKHMPTTTPLRAPGASASSGGGVRGGGGAAPASASVRQQAAPVT